MRSQQRYRHYSDSHDSYAAVMLAHCSYEQVSRVPSRFAEGHTTWHFAILFCGTCTSSLVPASLSLVYRESFVLSLSASFMRTAYYKYVIKYLCRLEFHFSRKFQSPLLYCVFRRQKILQGKTKTALRMLAKGFLNEAVVSQLWQGTRTPPQHPSQRSRFLLRQHFQCRCETYAKVVTRK